MSRAEEQNHLDTIFKQKKALRSVSKRDLKSMDPSLRSNKNRQYKGLFWWLHGLKLVTYFLLLRNTRKNLITGQVIIDLQSVLLADEPVDLLLLPGLAFDKAGRRLGRGGGYYDAFLTRYQERATERNWKQPLKIALSYSVQILDVDTKPPTPNDVLVDAVVSPSGLIPISPAALEICR
ncbi:hypothetical protein K7X08_000039 [Anisodus acutangulus]|uniref:5-formyltetrahydrofolate cyclo-ligase n=1 Tax=Anisodus acutangulus TaxID=402998 RepID=A0A9Q1M6K3_9SOLA|nr:hypothetical protein K7X08_000039 [Anisodus acutangulus]